MLLFSFAGTQKGQRELDGPVSESETTLNYSNSNGTSRYVHTAVTGVQAGGAADGCLPLSD